jgi:uncharacterized repeat protein (TIGR03803 family)
MPRTNRISAGNLYGATSAGGTGQCAPDNPFSGCGTIFELSSSLSGGSWTEQVLYNFTGGSDGDLPYTGLVFDQAGNLYGTAVEGGRITEPFLPAAAEQSSGCRRPPRRAIRGAKPLCTSLELAGTPPVTVAFSYSGLIFGKGGAVYGTTIEGGGSGGFGTVFQIQP